MDSPSIQSDREMVHDRAALSQRQRSPVIELSNGKSLNATRVRLFGLGKECGQGPGFIPRHVPLERAQRTPFERASGNQFLSNRICTSGKLRSQNPRARFLCP